MGKIINTLLPVLRIDIDSDFPSKTLAVFGSLIIAILLTVILTPISMKLASKVGVVDHPDGDRHIHTKPTPLLGGVAIYTAFMITFMLSVIYRMFFTDDPQPFLSIVNSRVQGILIGSTFIMIVGLIDDKYGMNAKLKLLLQIIAACILVLPCFGVRFTIVGETNLNDFLYFGSILTIIWVVVICNMINLMDGLDGLAAGVVAISAITFLVISITMFGTLGMAIISAILAGVTIGFLFFNFNPAKTFMGDSGALFLGYIIASISVLQNWKVATVIALGLPILILSVPVCDITFAVIRRLLNGKHPFTADRGHIHHRLMDSGLSQRRTVFIIYGLTLLGCVLAIIISNQIYLHKLNFSEWFC